MHQRQTLLGQNLERGFQIQKKKKDKTKLNYNSKRPIIIII